LPVWLIVLVKKIEKLYLYKRFVMFWMFFWKDSYNIFGITNKEAKFHELGKELLDKDSVFKSWDREEDFDTFRFLGVHELLKSQGFFGGKAPKFLGLQILT